MRMPFRATRGSRAGPYLLIGPPPRLTRRGQEVDGIVVFVPSRERIRIRELNTRAIVLRPPRNAEFAVVFGQLMHPPLADEGHVADNPRRCEPWKIAHDIVLQLLCLEDAQPPVLRVR